MCNSLILERVRMQVFGSYLLVYPCNCPFSLCPLFGKFLLRKSAVGTVENNKNAWQKKAGEAAQIKANPTVFAI